MLSSLDDKVSPLIMNVPNGSVLNCADGDAKFDQYCLYCYVK